jgi:hypothetical protein
MHVSAHRRLRTLATAAIALSLVGCGSTQSPPAPTSGTTSATGSPVSSVPAATEATPSISPEASTASVEPSAAPASAAPAPSTPPTLNAGVLPDPSIFVATIDNPWLPMKPGTVWRYHGSEGGETSDETLTVTNRTKIVAGVRCAVLTDVLKVSGHTEEATEDWYAQDRDGNVWYFGEATAVLNGAGKVVSTEGSWEAGVKGATPGIFMPAKPSVGLSGVQESFAGHAEDRYVVMFPNMKVRVPAGTYTGALVTTEWTTLEPGVISEKAYVKGIGEVRERDIAGGSEKLELVRMTKP